MARIVPDSWISRIFSAQAGSRGGMVRRAVPLVEREIGRDRFVAGGRARGLHLIRNGNQFIAIRNQAGLHVLC